MAKENTLVANFMRQFRDQAGNLKQLSATQFMDVWKHYDKDGNGFIEGKEMDEFLKDIISSVTVTEVGPEVVSGAVLPNVKNLFLDAFDENNDKRIDITELAQILPLEESFLLIFRRNNPLDSSVEFMKTWCKFDKDSSGYIEADELKNFLQYLLQQQGDGNAVADEKLIEYTDTMLQIFDSNKDGKLQLSEMAKLLPVKENYLSLPIFKGGSKLTMADVDKVFKFYDADENGSIEDEELEGFLKDLMELVHDDYDKNDLESFKRAIMKACDKNNDGKIDKEELTVFLQMHAVL